MAKDDINSKEKVYNFLHSYAIAVLSTVSPDGKPYASPIYFIPDKELNCYFVTKSDTKKSKNVKSNNDAALTVIHPTLPITVQANGLVEEIEDPQMYAKIADANAKEIGGFSWPPPLSKLESEGYLLLYKFTPNWLRVADFTEPEEKTEIQKNIFHQIIPSETSR